MTVQKLAARSTVISMVQLVNRCKYNNRSAYEGSSNVLVMLHKLF